MSSASASILHADLDAFYASVEQRDHPELLGRPVIVGGGVVLSASYEARACGVRTAMGGRRALALCPHAIVMPPRMAAYTAASRAVFEVFDDVSPVVEALSIDEAFLDVGGMERIAGTPLEIAGRLRQRVRREAGLPITVGIARTKFLAKVASGVAKPDGLLLVPADHELGFLHPLPVERLWGVGEVTAAKLRRRGIETVGEVATYPEPALIAMLGRASGRQLHALSRNRDPRRVEPGRRRRSVGAQRAMGRGPHRPDAIEASLVALVDRVMGRLRKGRRACRTVTLRLRFDDFSRATRSHTLPDPTTDTLAVLDATRALMLEARPLIRERGLTLVGIAVSNLVPLAPLQLHLATDGGRNGALDAAVDDVRNRFGTSAVTRAVLIGRDTGFTVPLLPD
jgi:DNA polymerase IV